jgi:hypothetical protein
MRTLLCGLLISTVILIGPAVAGERSMGDLRLKIEGTSPTGIVKVQILNSSDRPIRIWRESNSWGAAHWRVLVLRNGELSTFFQNPDQGFTKNNPAFDEIAPGGTIEKTLSLNDGNWRGLGKQKVGFESGQTIIVIYDVPKTFAWPPAQVTVEARNMAVWYGVAATSTTIR